jgi:hypothetical protein
LINEGDTYFLNLLKIAAMKPVLSLLFLLHFTFYTLHFSYSQSPGWVNYESRLQQYPAGNYLTGFTSQIVRETDNPEDVKRMLLENARTQLVESISISIRSEATLNVENYNAKTLEIFKQASSSISQADLTGLQSGEYYDTRKKEAYAFVWLNKADYLNSLKNSLLSETEQLTGKLESAQKLAAAGNKEAALKIYYNSMCDIREIEGKLAIVLALGSEASANRVSELETMIIKGISDLQSSPHGTLEELCLFLADALKHQLSSTDRQKMIRAGSFTWMDTRMGSDFAVQLQSTLKTRLVSEGFNVSASESTSGRAGDNLTLSGTCWPAGAALKVIANITGEGSGKILASAENFLPLSWLDERKIACLPPNYQSAIALDKELATDELTGEGLVIKLWTDKGNSNPVYRNDELMKVWVQVNRPCFVRLIYYLADGSRVLLLDSWYVDEEKVNTPYLLPQRFVCAAPFGAEVLQMVAQTEQFRPLAVKSEGGYDFISDSDKQIMIATRGMKKEKPALLIAEKRMNITTIEK